MKIEAMLWVLVLVSLALAIVSRSYRKYGLIVSGLAVLAIVSFIVLARNDDIPPPAAAVRPPAAQVKRIDFEQLHVEKLDQQDPEARNRIAVAEIRFDQITRLHRLGTGFVRIDPCASLQ